MMVALERPQKLQTCVDLLLVYHAPRYGKHSRLIWWWLHSSHSLKLGKKEVLNVKRSTILNGKMFENYQLSPQSHLSHAGQKLFILFLVTYFIKVLWGQGHVHDNILGICWRRLHYKRCFPSQRMILLDPFLVHFSFLSIKFVYLVIYFV